PMSASNMTKCDYDPKANVKTDGGIDIVASPKAPRGVSYYATLGQSFRVATWSQIPCLDADKPDSACANSDTFEVAYKSAPSSLRKVHAYDTGPIAIVAHRRGGLIGRRLLKEFGTAGGRIKWFVTLHTPHKGSGLSARATAVDNMTSAFIKALPKDAAKIAE